MFFPETKGLELEDIDHIFDKGGITGGVWGSKGGRTVTREDAILKGDTEENLSGKDDLDVEVMEVEGKE